MHCFTWKPELVTNILFIEFLQVIIPRSTWGNFANFMKLAWITKILWKKCTGKPFANRLASYKSLWYENLKKMFVHLFRLIITRRWSIYQHYILQVIKLVKVPTVTFFCFLFEISFFMEFSMVCLKFSLAVSSKL